MNSAILRHGNRLAKETIAKHVLNSILVPIANELIVWATNLRVGMGHNMTGNTVNSYAAGVYVDGHLAYMRGSWEDVPSPLTRKLNFRQRFLTSWQRWDGSVQEQTFKGKVPTNGAIEPDRCIAFLNGYQSHLKWEIVVCNGVEYASYQEQIMNIDTLTQSYAEAQSEIPSVINQAPKI